jgi:hypothetical protein
MKTTLTGFNQPWYLNDPSLLNADVSVTGFSGRCTTDTTLEASGHDGLGRGTAAGGGASDSDGGYVHGFRGTFHGSGDASGYCHEDGEGNG